MLLLETADFSWFSTTLWVTLRQCFMNFSVVGHLVNRGAMVPNTCWHNSVVANQGVQWGDSHGLSAFHGFQLERNWHFTDWQRKRSIVQCPGKSVAPTNSSVWEALLQTHFSVISHQFRKIGPMAFSSLISSKSAGVAQSGCDSEKLIWL